MSASAWTHLDVRLVVEETEKAFLLLLKDGTKLWVPLSQISEPWHYIKGDRDCTISVSNWFAQQKGLSDA